MGRATGLCLGVGLEPGGFVCLGVVPPRGVGLVVTGVESVSGSAVGSGVGSTADVLFGSTFETDELFVFEFPISVFAELSIVASGDGEETTDSSVVGSGEGSTTAAPGPKFIYAQIPPPIPMAKRKTAAIAPNMATIFPVDFFAGRTAGGASATYGAAAAAAIASGCDPESVR